MRMRSVHRNRGAKKSYRGGRRRHGGRRGKTRASRAYYMSRGGIRL